MTWCRRYLEVNVCSKKIRKLRKMLLYGSCIELDHPEILKTYENEYAMYPVCMEADHFNMIGFKLVGTLSRCPPRELIVLTVDGSPHCLQLHHVVEEAVKVTKAEVSVKHMVLHEGKLIEIPSNVVKMARYLHKVLEIHNKLKTILSSHQST